MKNIPYRITNIFSLLVGIGVIIFGYMGKIGAVPNIVGTRVYVFWLLGAVLIIVSLFSIFRRR